MATSYDLNWVKKYFATRYFNELKSFIEKGIERKDDKYKIVYNLASDSNTKTSIESNIGNVVKKEVLFAIQEFFKIVDKTHIKDRVFEMILNLSNPHIIKNGKFEIASVMSNFSECLIKGIADEYGIKIDSTQQYKDLVLDFFSKIGQSNNAIRCTKNMQNTLTLCGYIRNQYSLAHYGKIMTDENCLVFARYMIFGFISCVWFVNKCMQTKCELNPIMLRLSVQNANGQELIIKHDGKSNSLKITEDRYENNEIKIKQFELTSYEISCGESKIEIPKLDENTWGVTLTIDFPNSSNVEYKALEVNLEYLGLESGNNKINDTVNEINQLLAEISAKCGDIGAVNKAIFEINDVLSNNVSSVNSLESKLDDIATKLSEIKDKSSDNIENELKSFTNELQNSIDAVRNEVSGIKSYLKKINNQAWFRYALTIAIIFVAVVGIFVADMTIGLFPFTKGMKEWAYFNISDNEHFAELAFDAGSGNVAYDYAQKLEIQGELEQACKWYRNAITQYEALVEKTKDPEVAYTLAKMYLRGKGVFDLDKAKHFAMIAAPKYGKGLYIYTLTRSRDWQQAKDDIALYKDRTWSEDNSFFELASVICKLYDDKQEDINLESNLDKVRKLCNDTTAEASIDAQFEMALLAEGGINSATPNIATFVMELEELIKKNYLPAQMVYASFLIELNCYDLAFPVIDMAWENGEIDALPMLLMSLENIEFDGKDDYLSNIYSAFDNSPELNNSEINKILSAKILEKEGMIDAALDTLISTYNESRNLGIKDADMENMCMTLNLKQEKPNFELFIPDTVQGNERRGIMDYRKAVRYAKGYGVAVDSLKADSLLRKAASNGNNDAKFALAIKLRDAGELLDAINLLYSIDDENNIAQEKLYEILNRLDPKLGLNYLSSKNNIVLSALENRELISVEDLFAQIERIEMAISLVRKEGRNMLMGYLLTKLAGLYSCVPRDIDPYASDFAIVCYDLAMGINRSDYLSPYLLSEFLSELGNNNEAEACFKIFCNRYFNEDGSCKQESEKAKILTIMQKKYPQLIDSLNQCMGCDLTKDLIPDNKPVGLRYEYNASVDIFKY